MRRSGRRLRKVEQAATAPTPRTRSSPSSCPRPPELMQGALGGEPAHVGLSQRRRRSLITAAPAARRTLPPPPATMRRDLLCLVFIALLAWPALARRGADDDDDDEGEVEGEEGPGLPPQGTNRPGLNPGRGQLPRDDIDSDDPAIWRRHPRVGREVKRRGCAAVSVAAAARTRRRRTPWSSRFPLPLH